MMRILKIVRTAIVIIVAATVGLGFAQFVQKDSLIPVLPFIVSFMTFGSLAAGMTWLVLGGVVEICRDSG